MGVADSGVFARIGEDFGAVDGDGDLADFEDFGAGGEFQNLGESMLEEGRIFPSKGAKGVVVRVGVGAEETHGDIAEAGCFDLTTGKKFQCSRNRPRGPAAWQASVAHGRCHDG